MPAAAFFFCSAHGQRALVINKLTRVVAYADGYLAKLAQYSYQCQARFSKCQRDSQRHCPRAWRNLSFAQQRFDSTALPLGRVCLCMGAALLFPERNHCNSG